MIHPAVAGEPDVPDIDLITTLEQIAAVVAVDAAAFIVQERPHDLAAATKSSATDLVTVMDQAAQERILDTLGRLRPQDAVLGEESGGRSGTSGITWVVDPIDGTTNYVYNLPAYAVSIAAVVGDPTAAGAWTPVAGAVVDAASGTVYRAGRGLGARRVDTEGTQVGLHGPAPTALATALLATGFSYAAHTRERQARLLVDLLPQVRDIRRLGSAALDLCRVAAGEVDGYYETALNPWDLAAGWLVCREAGVLTGGPGGLHDAVPTGQLMWVAGADLAPALAPLVAELSRKHGISA
ncbi:MAG: inositol monophosphatase [Phycicoccus sp.]|nr:inositol monophosphatase [Phycicoccus sp.]